MTRQAVISTQDKSWSVEVASTQAELSQGLSGRTSLLANTGMLFDLGSDQIVTITMLQMLFPLDIVFVSGELVVTEVLVGVPVGVVTHNTIPARYFIEVNQGEADGVLEGNVVTITGYTPATSALELLGVPLEKWLAFAAVSGIFTFMMKPGLFRALTSRRGAPRLAPSSEWQQRGKWEDLRAWIMTHDPPADPVQVAKLFSTATAQVKRGYLPDTKWEIERGKLEARAELIRMAEQRGFKGWSSRQTGA